MGHTIEPELRRLGMPTRMVRGKIVIGEEDGSGEGVCLSEFAVHVRAYWSAATGEVTEVEPEAGTDAADGMEE
ncbi:hypothetical protein G7054_g3786 [Neopestalotiopsis clavispora]|nr:hypothetical protein G7054_g3786 [Neopestalotiopsis clavispora]